MKTETAEFMTRYGKIVLVIWTIVALILLPVAIDSVRNMDSSFVNMDSDTSEEKKVIDRYFDNPQIDTSRIPIVVISYDSSEGYRQLQGDISINLPCFTEYLAKYLSKNSHTAETYVLKTEGTKNEGMILFGVDFSDSSNKSFIENQTEELRSIVNSAVDEYMFSLYEDHRYFDVYLTGNQALAEDSNNEIMISIIIAAIVTVVVALILMGLFFGSIMTSVVTTVSILVSAIFTLGIFNGIATHIITPLILVECTLLVVMAVSFAQNILILSTYRNRLKKYGNTDEALMKTSMFTTSRILIFTAAMLACCIVMMFSKINIIKSLGICLAVGFACSAVVSITIPVPLMSVTRNEMFWTKTIDGKIRWPPIRRAYDSINAMFDKVSKVKVFSNRKKNIAIIAVFLLAGAGFGTFLIVDDPYGKVSCDVYGSTVTGDSAKGLEVMKNYNDGGFTYPYNVVVTYNAPVAKIEKQYLDMSIFHLNHTFFTLQWTADCYADMTDLGNLIRSSDNNISSALSIEKWDLIVDQAKAQWNAEHPSDPAILHPTEILAIAQDLMNKKNWAAGAELKNEIETIRSFAKTEIGRELIDMYIMDFCGPIIDYAINDSTGYIGYRMNPDKTIVVDHIRMFVYTKDTASSDVSKTTTENIRAAANAFYNSHPSVASTAVTGDAIILKDIYDDVNNTYWTLILVMIAVLVVVMLAAERKPQMTIVSFAVSAVGTVISSALAIILMRALGIGDPTLVTLTVIPMVGLAIGTWLGHLQFVTARNSESLGMMKGELDPVIIVTAITIITAAVVMSTCTVRLISQVALAIIIMMIVEGFLIRIVMSPCAWSLFNLKISLKKKDKEEQTEGQE